MSGKEKLQEAVHKAIYKIEDSISSLILCITDLEKYRRELLSHLEYPDKKDIPSLERAYFYSGPPKMLYILIPAVPPSLNHTVRLKMSKQKYAYSAVFAWWDIKIKNALDNLENPQFEYFDSFIPSFSKAVVLVKVTFSPKIVGDLDNYAVKAIVDSLKKNNIIKDDNMQIFNTFLAQSEISDSERGKIELFITEDKRVSDFIANICREWQSLIPQHFSVPTETDNKAEKSDESENFFINADICMNMYNNADKNFPFSFETDRNEKYCQ